MDTHRPYYPPHDIQRNHLPSPLSYSRIKELNEIAAPWEFIKRTEKGEALTTEIEQLRSLYAGEVSFVDKHLSKIISELKKQGIYKNTIIIVTSDHGENLGEVDLLGNRRFGHEASVSRQLIHVPLLISNPGLAQRTVSEHVSIKDIFNLIIDGIPNDGIESDDIVNCMRPDEVVLSEYPALGGASIAEQYPEVSKEALELRTSVHHSVACLDDWMLVADSRGETLAWQDGTEVSPASAPERLQTACERSISSLVDKIEERELSDSEIAQLKALGYM